jgi:thioesterase domain-containing protein
MTWVELIDAGYAASVHNHTEWYALAEELAEQARDQRLLRPLGVAGHSLGGDDAIRLTTALGKEGIPVDLLITFDPVLTGTVPVGPRQVMNFFRNSQAPPLDGRVELPKQQVTENRWTASD